MATDEPIKMDKYKKFNFRWQSNEIFSRSTSKQRIQKSYEAQNAEDAEEVVVHLEEEDVYEVLSDEI